jgi:nucleotide-binding universal stress UspA family protein
MKRKNTVIDVSGIEIDERGRVKKDKDADESERRGAGVRKKKKREPKKPQFEEVDEKYERGKDPKAGKKKKKLVIEGECKAVATIPKAEADKKIAKKKAKAIAAIEEYANIPESGDEFDNQYRAMFENAVDLAQRLEQQMAERVNSRDVYALNTLYSQIRELIADMRSTRDVTQIVSELQRRACDPFVKLMGQVIIDMFFAMQSNISALVKNNDIREELIKKLQNLAADQGARVQDEYGKMLDQVRNVLM